MFILLPLVLLLSWMSIAEDEAIFSGMGAILSAGGGLLLMMMFTNCCQINNNTRGSGNCGKCLH